MTKVKLLVREYEKEKDAFRKLVLVGSIEDELEKIKKELSKKVKQITELGCNQKIIRKKPNGWFRIYRK